LLEDQQQKFVASLLLEDATKLLGQLEESVMRARSSASPLLMGISEDFSSAILLMRIIDAFRTYLEDTSKHAEDLKNELGKKGDEVEIQDIQVFLKKMVVDEDLFNCSSEQIRSAIYPLADSNGRVSKEKLLQQLKRRYVCAATLSLTEGSALKASPIIRKLEVAEVVEALGEPVQPESGPARLHVRSEVDGEEGYASLTGQKGAELLELHTPLKVCQRQCERELRDTADAILQSSEHFERKIEELAKAAGGPLADAKCELEALQPRVTEIQGAYSQLKVEFLKARSRHDELAREEWNRQKDAADARATARVTAGVRAKVADLTAEIETSLTNAQKILKSGTCASVSQFNECMSSFEAASAKIKDAYCQISAQMKDLQASSKIPTDDAKSVLVGLTETVRGLDVKCQNVDGPLKAARHRTDSAAQTVLVQMMKAHAQILDYTAEGLLEELCPSGCITPAQNLRQFLEKEAESQNKVNELQFFLERYKDGMPKFLLLDALQEFRKVVKDVSITEKLDLQSGEAIRKVKKGEFGEVLEAEQVDDGSSLTRVRCRWLRDKV